MSISIVYLIILVVLFFTTIGIYATFMEYKKRKLYTKSKAAYSTFLVKGVNSIAVGLALLIGLYSLGEGPWLLGGLIPIFVGNMHIIFYLLGVSKV